MKRTTITALAATLFTACAAPPKPPGAGSGQTYTPIIDIHGVDQARYSNDLSACRAYAGNVDVQGDALAGAIGGALMAGIISGMLGGNNQMNMQAANAGGFAGVTGAGARAIGKQERVIINCMALRGYRTLDAATVAPMPMTMQQQPLVAAPVASSAPTVSQSIYGTTQAPPAPRQVTGTDTMQAIQYAKANACHADPRVTLAVKGPGFETYSVPCTNGDTIMLRCEFGNCRALQ